MSKKFSVVITGGGTGAIDQILRQGGMSEYFVDGLVPYASKSLDRLIGGKPDKYCSKEVAEKLALVAYNISRLDNPTADSIMGVGVSASLHKAGYERTNRENVAYVVFQVDNVVYYYHIDLKEITQPDSPNMRADQEYYLSTLIAAKVKLWLAEGLFTDIPQNPEVTEIDNVLLGVYNKDCGRVDIGVKLEPGDKYCLFPGSFNPPHIGHIDMARKAYDLTGYPVVFEISVYNWEKPVIHPSDLQKRVGNLLQFEDEPWFGGVTVTVAKEITKKIYYLRPEYVIMGQDTALRLLRSIQSKYQARELIEVAEEVPSRFMVFDRLDWQKAYSEERHRINLAMDSDLSPLFGGDEFNRLFWDISEADYKDDGTSSCKIRLMANV